MEKTLKRDDYTCRFCGFHSLRYQRVIPYPDESGELPFATACTFCEQCIILERAGISGAGVLVWLPEITQADLNHIARAIYVARASESDMGTVATQALDALMTRRADVKKRLGSDDPLLLATVMHEMMTQKDAAKVPTKIDSVRLLPAEKHMIHTSSGDVNQFPQMVKYWLSPEGPYARLPVNSWRDMFKTAAAKTGNA